MCLLYNITILYICVRVYILEKLKRAILKTRYVLKYKVKILLGFIHICEIVFISLFFESYFLKQCEIQ